MARRNRWPVTRIVSLGLLTLLATQAHAQQIQWRGDYNKARQEARARGLPIFLDVGTAGCLPCKQLETTTFRDPALVNFVNENFVPVKVDGQKATSIIKALGIQYFPTLVIATPEGKVLDMRTGYMDAAKFGGWSQQVLAQLRQPAGPNPNNIQLTAGQKPAAPGADRSAQARFLLALAEEEFRTEQFASCLVRCNALATTYADLPEAESARQLAAKLRSDPERLRATCEKLTHTLCDMYLELARSLIQAGQRDQATPYLQWVSQACPGTPQASAAQKMLGDNPAN